MTGYNDILKVRKFEKEAIELGFEICDGSHWSNQSNHTSYIVDEMSNVRLVGLRPLDKCHPCYTRGVVVFTGTMEEASRFLQGIRFAYDTDKAIGLSNEKKRCIAEAKELERIRKREEARIKQEEQKKIWKILSDGSVEEDEEVPF